MNKDLPITDVSRITGINATTLRILARDGQLPGAYKIGGSWRVNREKFDQHRSGGQQKPAPEGEAT